MRFYTSVFVSRSGDLDQVNPVQRLTRVENRPFRDIGFESVRMFDRLQRTRDTSGQISEISRQRIHQDFPIPFAHRRREESRAS